MAANYKVELRAPATLASEELAALVTILAEGGAVDIAAARKEIPRATRLAVVAREGKLVGCGAIKRARPWYASSVRDHSGVSFGSYVLELGYVARSETAKGNRLSEAIVHELLASYNGDLFATTDHEAMKRTLEENGFVQHGKAWRGNRGLLSLWLWAGRST